MAIPATLRPDLFAGLDRHAPVRRLAGETMGTGWSLAVAGGPADPRAIVQPVMDAVIAESSLWAADSAILRFNRAPAGQAVALAPGCAAVVRAALAIAAASGGAFDPCLGVHSHLWGFGPDGEQPLPETLPATGRWRDLAWQGDALIQPGGVALDLNGIAKGDAVDRAADALLQAGARHFLFGIGGEYRGEGVRPDGQPWWTAIELPPGCALRPIHLALSGMAIATSGDYRRSFLHAGQRHAHSIDPATGRPIAEGVASVAVLGARCMMADAQATAITVMGEAAGMDWAAAHDLAVHMLIRDGRGFRERISPALAAMLE